MNESCPPCPGWAKVAFVGRHLFWLVYQPGFSRFQVTREALCFTLLDAFLTFLWLEESEACGWNWHFLLHVLVTALDNLYVPVSLHLVLANSQPRADIALSFGASFRGLTVASGFGAASVAGDWWFVADVTCARLKRQVRDLAVESQRPCLIAVCSRLVLFFAMSWPRSLLIMAEVFIWLVRSHQWFIRSLSDAELSELRRNDQRLVDQRTRLLAQRALRHHCPLPFELCTIAQSYV